MSQLIKARVDVDLKTALLARNSFVVDTLRGIKAAILDDEIKTNSRDTGIDDVQIEKVLAREAKKRQEAARMYDQNDRLELADNERAELDIIETYLPQQLADNELENIIINSADNLDIHDMSGMGRLIGDVKARVGASVDGSRIAAAVKLYLQAQ